MSLNSCETEIKLKKGFIQILGSYRPPDSNIDHGINILSDQLGCGLHQQTRTVIIRDITIENLDKHTNDLDNMKLDGLLTSFNLRHSLPLARITTTMKTSLNRYVQTLTLKLFKLKAFSLDSQTTQHIWQQSTLHQKKIQQKIIAKVNHKTMNLMENGLSIQNWDSALFTQDPNVAYM